MRGRGGGGRGAGGGKLGEGERGEGERGRPVPDKNNSSDRLKILRLVSYSICSFSSLKGTINFVPISFQG